MPAWVRRGQATLRSQRDAHIEVLRTSTDEGVKAHARICAALCRLITAVLLDHADGDPRQLALAGAWLDALDRITWELQHERPRTPAQATAFADAVEALLSDYSAEITLPGPALVLLPEAAPVRRAVQFGPFADIARRIQHKAAIEALRDVPDMQVRSPDVERLLLEAINAAQRTAADALPDGPNRPARVFVLRSAAHAVAGLASAHGWIARVEDPYLHPGAAILFTRVQDRLEAARALAALDVLLAGPHATTAMTDLRAAVESAVKEERQARVLALLKAHAPTLECARAMLVADHPRFNAIGAALAEAVGERLPSPETVKQLERLRRVAVLAEDPAAAGLVHQVVETGDVDEATLQRVEGVQLSAPVDLRTVPSQADAAAMLTRRGGQRVE